MPRKKSQNTTNKKVLTVTNEIHKQIMDIAKSTKSSANDVIAVLFSKTDSKQVVASIKAERKKQESDKKAEVALRKELLKKAQKLNTSQLKKLLESTKG